MISLTLTDRFSSKINAMDYLYLKLGIEVALPSSTQRNREIHFKKMYFVIFL